MQMSGKDLKKRDTQNGGNAKIRGVGVSKGTPMKKGRRLVL